MTIISKDRHSSRKKMYIFIYDKDVINSNLLSAVFQYWLMGKISGSNKNLNRRSNKITYNEN